MSDLTKPNKPNKPNKPRGPVFEYFSDAKIALLKEVRENHPTLVATLARDLATGDPEAKEWTRQLGHIAAYAYIALDGAYSLEDIEALTDHLWGKLVEKRTGIARAPAKVDTPKIITH